MTAAGEVSGESVTERILEVTDPGLGSEHMLINIGPQHPATHGVLRLICELDGETVLKVTPDIGFLHTSFEKLGEYRTWNQIVPLTDRIDYLAPLMYNCVYVMAVEKLMGLQVTERCKVVRVLCMEMDRIFSHLLWFGDDGDRRGGVHAFPVRLPGARTHLQAARVLHGRAHHHVGHAHRGHDGGSSRRLDRFTPRLREDVPEHTRRDRLAPDHERNPSRAHTRRGSDLRRGRDQLWLYRPEPQSLRGGLRPP